MSDDATVRIPPHPRSGGGLAVIGLVLLLVAAVVAGLQWRQLVVAQQAVRDGNAYAALGVYQIEIEYLRLAVYPAATAELPLRFELFASRVAAARTGGARTMIGEAADAEVAHARLEAFVSQADALFDSGLPPAAADG